jgi:uncharacterized protein YoaH (UPF0181 family)
MKLEKLFFFMLEKEPQKTEKAKEVYLYDEMEPAVEKIREYMTGGVSAEDIELTKVSIKEEGMKAEVAAWSTIAEALVKKSAKK